MHPGGFYQTLESIAEPPAPVANKDTGGRKNPGFSDDKEMRLTGWSGVGGGGGGSKSR